MESKEEWKAISDISSSEETKIDSDTGTTFITKTSSQIFMNDKGETIRLNKINTVMRPDEWVTMKELAKMLGVHERTALRFVQTGKIKGIRISPRKWRVHEDAVAEFLKQAELDAEVRAQEENTKVAPLPGDDRTPLTINEAAEWLGVKPAWIRDLITMGRLPAREENGRYLIAPVDLEAYAANRKRKPMKK